MSRHHAAQIRLLSLLALALGADFVDLARLEQVHQIRSGDDLFVPSLVARGWAELAPRRRCSVRITEAGRFVLDEADHGGAGLRF